MSTGILSQMDMIHQEIKEPELGPLFLVIENGPDGDIRQQLTGRPGDGDHDNFVDQVVVSAIGLDMEGHVLGMVFHSPHKIVGDLISEEELTEEELLERIAFYTLVGPDRERPMFDEGNITLEASHFLDLEYIENTLDLPAGWFQAALMMLLNGLLNPIQARQLLYAMAMGYGPIETEADYKELAKDFYQTLASCYNRA